MLLPALALLLPAADVLGPALSIPLPGSPRGFAVADLTGDGHVDALVALADQDALHLVEGPLFGHGAPRTSIPVGAGPRDVAVGDLDGDGAPDLVVSLQGGQAAQVLLGVGGGAFGPPTTIPLGAAPTDALLADLDGDGPLDLALGTATAGVVLLLRGRGDGTFDPPTSAPVVGPVGRLSAGDVDGDADLDVAVAATWEGTLLLRNAGSFAFQVEEIGGTFGNESFWVCLVDADQDLDLDLVHAEGDGLSADPVLKANDGAGGFAGPFLWFLFEFAWIRISEAADLDGDLDPDFVSVGGNFASAEKDRLYVRFGAPGFAYGDLELHLLDGRFEDLACVDLDADGRPDVIGSVSGTDELLLLENGVCPGPPSLASVLPAVVPALAPQPTTATLQGCGLGGVTAVHVAGAPAAFAVHTDSSVSVELPLAPQLGPATVQVSGPLGSASAAFEYAAPEEPLLALHGAAALSVSGGLALLAGAAPGDLVFVAVSPDHTPTVLPGIVALDIGRNGSLLTLLATLAVPAKAWSSYSAPVPPQLLGAKLHFQGAVLAPAAPVFPLATTAVVTAIVAP